MKFCLFAAALFSLFPLHAIAQDAASTQEADAPVVAQSVPSPYRNDMGLYVQPEFSYMHDAESDTGPFAFLGEGNNSQWFRGAALGFYDEFRHSGPNSWGFDMRLNMQRGNGAKLNAFLLGVRYGRHLEGSKLHPFAELIGGVAGTASAHNNHRVSRPAFQVSAGADYPLFKHLDWRVAELSYGSFRSIGADAFTGTDVHSRPAVMAIGIGSGFVLRF